MLIAQLTDSHVTVDGPESADLLAALSMMHRADPRPDVIVLSGDTVDHGRPAEYGRLREILATATIPVYVVPGNHDRRDALRAVLPRRYLPNAGERIRYAVDDAGPVRIIALDTSEPGRVAGRLTQACLDWLEATLETAPDRPAFLFMHHPPFATGVRLADIFGFHGLRRFRRIIEAQPSLQRIVAGHIHSVRATRIGNAVALTSLSTTPQLVPELFERHPVGMRAEPAGVAYHAWDGARFTTTFAPLAPRQRA